MEEGITEVSQLQPTLTEKPSGDLLAPNDILLVDRDRGGVEIEVRKAVVPQLVPRIDLNAYVVADLLAFGAGRAPGGFTKFTGSSTDALRDPGGGYQIPRYSRLYLDKYANVQLADLGEAWKQGLRQQLEQNAKNAGDPARSLTDLLDLVF